MPNKWSDRRCGADPSKNESGRTGTFGAKEKSCRLVSTRNGLSIAVNSSNKES